MNTVRQKRSLVFLITFTLTVSLLLSSFPAQTSLTAPLAPSLGGSPKKWFVAQTDPNRQSGQLHSSQTRSPQSISADERPHRALSLDGVDDYIQVRNHPDLNPGSEITIEAWVYRLDSSRCETVMGKDWITSYWLGFCPDRVRFYAAGLGTQVDGNATVPAHRWTHIAVTYDGTTRRYYIDGELDLASNAHNGPVVTNDANLGIGRDLVSDFPQNNFYGYLDEVRLWNVVRPQAEIQANMHRELGAQPGLVAAWRFNGYASDVLWRHNGSSHGNPGYTFRAVLPRDITVYRSTAAVTVDGICGATEYATQRVSLQNWSGTVYLQHDAEDLYVCFERLGFGENGLAAVTIDRDHSRDDPAQPGDYRFIVDMDGATTAEEGDGAGGFVPLSTPPGSWEAAHTVTEFYSVAEFRISRDVLGIPADWNTTVGMDLVEFDEAIAGDNHWPVGTVGTLPSTWANVRFTNSVVWSPTFSFHGYVRRMRDETGVSGVAVQLFASNVGSTSLIATTRTDSEGYYSFSYSGYSPDVFLAQEIDPRGMYSVSADDGGDGSVVSPNLISYPGSDWSTSYSTGTFFDAEARPISQPFNRHYLIVYSNPVQEYDLWPIIDMKQGQGYQVETISTQTIEATVSGRDLAEKIRNWLRSRWQAYDPDPIYALLVGRNDVLPVRQWGWAGDLTHRTPDMEGWQPAVVTDWYYADLDSDWDTDGDGFYGEYGHCAPDQTEVPTVPWPAKSKEKDPCPPADSPLREGPHGTDPGSEDNWKAEISIGRIELNDRVEVRRALQTSVASESSGSLDKRKALITGGFWFFAGQSWNGTHYDKSNFWINQDWPGEGNQPYGDDPADDHLEVILRPILDTYMTDVTTLYEAISPGGDPNLRPTAHNPDFPLSRANLAAQWQTQGIGLVNVEGHGNRFGVVTAHWLHDWNNNRQIDNPANPAESSTCSERCLELGQDSFIDWRMPEPGGIAPIVFANACSTGYVWDRPPGGGVIAGPETIAGKLMGRGRAAAWIGALDNVTVSRLDDFQDDFNHDILGPPLLLGDALWKGMEGLINLDSAGYARDWRDATPQLFGDPAYSYWGNPADTRAPWPQAGRDWWTTNSTPYNGPSVGRVIWIATDNLPKSPPVVDRQGNIIVGGEAMITKFAPNGAVIDEASLSGYPIPFVTSPAIATDGLHVASHLGLYVLDPEFQMRDYIQPGTSLVGAPRVGPDGIVWVPTSTGMARITGAGVTEMLESENATGPVAFTPSGAAVWTTESGQLVGYHMDRHGNATTRVGSFEASFGTPTSPAVGPSADIYVGSSNGYIAAVTPFPFSGVWLFDTGAAIAAKSTVGLDGTIYVGNASGTVYALSSDGTLLWSRPLASPTAPPIVASLTADSSQLYVAAGSSLYALNLATGDVLWSVGLGGPTDERSTPIIGTNRTIYVTRSDRALVAIAQDGWLLAPSDVRVTAGIESVIVSWHDNSLGETGFRVERCEPDGTCFHVGTANADATSIQISQVPAGEPFHFRVQALGVATEEGLISANSPSDTNHASDFAFSDVTFVLPSAPSTPENLAASPESAEAIRVIWSYNDIDREHLLGFRVYRSDTAQGSYDLISSVGASAESFSDKDLSPNTEYFYKVAAENEGGPSPLAGPVSATTKSIELPAPTAFTVEPQTGGMALTWQDNATTETGYVVERRYPGVAGYEVLAELPANTINFTDTLYLANGRFGYRVKAVAPTTESDYAYTSAEYVEQFKIFLPLIRN